MLRNQSRGYYSINPAIEETEPNINALTSYRAESWFPCKTFYVRSGSKPLVWRMPAKSCVDVFDIRCGVDAIPSGIHHVAALNVKQENFKRKHAAPDLPFLPLDAFSYVTLFIFGR
jgi:hypothetical protein